MQWWRDKLKSNKLLLLDLTFYCFINKLKVPVDLGGDNFHLPCWFPLNDSESVKAVTLVFCNTQ